MITQAELDALIAQGDSIREKLLTERAILRARIVSIDEALERHPVSAGRRWTEEKQRTVQLSSQEVGRPGQIINGQDIIHATARFYGLTVDRLKGPERLLSVAKARHVAMYLVRTITSESFPEIGRYFGARDHTTVISAVAKIKGQLETNQALHVEVTTLGNTIREAQAARPARCDSWRRVKKLSRAEEVAIGQKPFLVDEITLVCNGCRSERVFTLDKVMEKAEEVIEWLKTRATRCPYCPAATCDAKLRIKEEKKPEKVSP
jgi:hypothetical protein